MAAAIPPDLVSAVREGRCILFLGAGAAKGANDGKGREAPDSNELAKLLADQFLGDGYEGLDLKSVYDLACSERDVRTVQQEIFNILDPIKPADFHLLIPKFAWAGLATTNYDLIVERSYASTSDSARLLPFLKDGDGATDRLSGDSVLYIKLHGCITLHQDVYPPLVASTEQLISFREGRRGQFDTFMEWAKTKTIIFCGYSFLDSNLRTLFSEIIKEGDNRPRHYIINRGARPAEINYWRERRVVAIDSTFEEFLKHLDESLGEGDRNLGRLAAAMSESTFTKFISTRGAIESDELKRYLTSQIEHVTGDMNPVPADPRRFYAGFDLGWYPFSAELDIRLPAVASVLEGYVERRPSAQRLPIVLIKGHAGSGKTVALRRMCFDAASLHGALCFYVGRSQSIIVDRFDEIFSLTNLPIFLFVDNVSEHRATLFQLLMLAEKRRANLRVVATESYNTWNVLCEDLEPFVVDVTEMRYLSEANIIKLLEKLELHNSLGYLKRLTPEARADELKHVHGRQLLVALLEATHGIPLVEIIEREYQSIEPPEARRIYLDICSLHRFGPPVRAGLISRIHDLSFADFAERLFKPLEAIVVLRKDVRSGDYVYEARHSYIAHELYTAVLTNQEERFDNLIRIITKLNPAFSYDQEVMSKLVRAEALQKILNDRDKIRQVYDSAESAFGEKAVILHQRGIFEMHAADSLGQLEAAAEWLERARVAEPANRSIKHSQAELDLRRSRLAENSDERMAWRRSAVERATALTNRSSSPYPHHTLLKAAVDGVKDAMYALENDASEAASLRLGDAIAHAEGTLRAGRQAFPNESVLLGEEGHLSDILSQSTRAEAAFEKAAKANPRSTLIARRLARLKRAKDNPAEAAEVLRNCLEYNPGSPDLHYDFALAVMETAPDADQTETDTLLYHLRRSFTPGDKNLQAQFWYARELCLAGRYDEAKPLFQNLAEARMPFHQKTEIRGIVLDHDGEAVEMIGTVTLWRDTWGFLSLPRWDMRVFLSANDIDETLAEYMTVGTTVRFNLAFTLKGPVATNVAV